MHSFVISKNVKWCHLIWPTQYKAQQVGFVNYAPKFCKLCVMILKIMQCTFCQLCTHYAHLYWLCITQIWQSTIKRNF